MAEKVKVFVSWSGELSRKLGQAVADWLPLALHLVEPYFTPEHMEKGTKWLPDISAELEASDIGIICLTRENLSNPWILFEAGALSNKCRSQVCTLLFDVEPADVKFPLAMFQATRFIKADVRKLVETINKAGAELSLKESTFSKVFEMAWPNLEETVRRTLVEHGNIDTGKQRTDRDILEEILELLRSAFRRREPTEAEKQDAESRNERIRVLLRQIESLKKLAEQPLSSSSSRSLSSSSSRSSSNSASSSPEPELSPSPSSESSQE